MGATCREADFFMRYAGSLPDAPSLDRAALACCFHRSTLLQGLTYQWVPLKPAARTVMVTSGPGCARGGLGANGAMWLFDVNRIGAIYLGELNGWGPGTLKTSFAGYQDVVTGWHMSAFETGLTYYRFDGKTYWPIDGADAVTDEDGNWKITPSKSFVPKK